MLPDFIPSVLVLVCSKAVRRKTISMMLLLVMIMVMVMVMDWWLWWWN